MVILDKDLAKITLGQNLAEITVVIRAKILLNNRGYSGLSFGSDNRSVVVLGQNLAQMIAVISGKICPR